MLKPPVRVEYIKIVAEICRELEPAIMSGNRHRIVMKTLEVARKLEEQYWIFNVVNN